MDGLVLWVAVGLRDYAMGMDAIAWITGFGGLATFYFTIFSLLRDAKTRKSIVAKQTTDHVANLELVQGHTLAWGRLRKQKCILTFLTKKQMTLVEGSSSLWTSGSGGGAISMNILNSCAGGRILLEYDEFFEPLLQSRAVIVKKLPKKEIYYGNTWSGIKRLTEELRELREKESQREKLLRVVAKLRSFRR